MKHTREETTKYGTSREDNRENKDNSMADSGFNSACMHCGKSIDEVELIGFSLICPLCGMPQGVEQNLTMTI